MSIFSNWSVQYKYGQLFWKILFPLWSPSESVFYLIVTNILNKILLKQCFRIKLNILRENLLLVGTLLHHAHTHTQMSVLKLGKNMSKDAPSSVQAGAG